VRKATPAYALVLGALIGGLLGGGGLPETVAAMISGAQSMMPSVLRILTSGVLAGALVKTGSAEKIADAIVRALGTRFALAAIALATLIVTAVGVFVDIAVITVAPVALAVGRRAGIPVPALLLAMVGGGKAGNVISPNPNTIAAADAFNVDLTALMLKNIVPALCALAVTILLARWLSRRGQKGGRETSGTGETNGTEDPGRTGRTCPISPTSPVSPPPSLWAAVAGPLVVVALLALRPLFGFAVDPLVALPAGGLVAILVCGKWRQTASFCEYGLSKVIGVSILLIGTGAVAGIVKNSGLNADMVALLNACHLPAFALAPLSSVLLSGATASTTAGVTIASQTFSGTLVQAGVPALSAAAMLHAGGTIFDALPHGSFFHATAGAVGMGVKDRLKLFPYGTLVGATSTIVSVLVYLCGF
ncbi:MAG: GntP family permease, partial [Lentisphaeria bacterium]|nr:GntP family permease [Lentisphaeria bacterium]